MSHQSTANCTLCKIFEAEISHHPTWKFSIAVNKEQEAKLREDIWMGRKLITLGREIAHLECTCAKSLADISYA